MNGILQTSKRRASAEPRHAAAGCLCYAFRWWTDVRGARPNEIPLCALLERMRDPPERPAEGEEAKRGIRRQSQMSAQCYQCESNLWFQASELLNGIGQRSPVGRPLRQSIQYCCCSEVTIRIYGMPKTRHVAAALQSRPQGPFWTRGRFDLIPEALYPESGPMTRSGQGGKTAEHCRVKSRPRGCDTTDGEARCIEFVIGAQDQRSLNQLRLTCI